MIHLFGPQVMGREDLAEVMPFFLFLEGKKQHVDEFQVFSLYI